MSPRKIFDKLIEAAWMCRFRGKSDGHAVRRALETGKEIPDDCLPGRLVMKLSQEECDVLSNLSSEDTQDRQD